MTTSARDIYGTGLRYPFGFVRRSGGTQTSTATSQDHAHIHESIRQILGTRIGERFMLPSFGSRLPELVFEANDEVLRGLLQTYILDALGTWEPRILVTDIIIPSIDETADTHAVPITIYYRLIDQQVPGNIVYPFYLDPSTG